MYKKILLGEYYSVFKKTCELYRRMNKKSISGTTITSSILFMCLGGLYLLLLHSFEPEKSFIQIFGLILFCFGLLVALPDLIPILIRWRNIERWQMMLKSEHQKLKDARTTVDENYQHFKSLAKKLGVDIENDQEDWTQSLNESENWYKTYNDRLMRRQRNWVINDGKNFVTAYQEIIQKLEEIS